MPKHVEGQRIRKQWFTKESAVVYGSNPLKGGRTATQTTGCIPGLSQGVMDERFNNMVLGDFPLVTLVS